MMDDLGQYVAMSQTIQKITQEELSKDYVLKKIATVFDAEIQKDHFKKKCKKICQETYHELKRKEKNALWKHPMIGYGIAFVSLVLSIYVVIKYRKM